jgi:hypothetical protein
MGIGTEFVIIGLKTAEIAEGVGTGDNSLRLGGTFRGIMTDFVGYNPAQVGFEGNIIN